MSLQAVLQARFHLQRLRTGMDKGWTSTGMDIHLRTGMDKGHQVT